VNISYSRVSSYLRCPYAHYLGYIRKLKLNKAIRPLHFGTDFHKLLEERNDPEKLKQAKKDIKEKFYAMPASWQSDIGDEYLSEIASIFKDYSTVWKDSPQPQKTEHKFELDIGNFKGEPIKFVGVIDELYLYKHNGEKFTKIGEHKTFSRKPDQNTLVMNVQKCLYAKATQIERGSLPRTVIWDYIKSTPAKEPIWLEKSSRFSDAKSDQITELSWNRACKKRGIDDPEIIKHGQDLYGGNISNFFFKAEMDLLPEMVDSIFDGFLYTCKQIVKQGEKNKTKNVTQDCGWCNFRDICFAEFTGGDIDYLLQKNYILKE